MFPGEPRIWGVVALVGCVGMTSAGLIWTGYRLGQAGEQEKSLAAKAAQERAAQRALDAVTAAVHKIEVKSETHIHPLRTEIRTNTVYRDCRHSPDGLRHLNALIEGDGSAGPGQGVVPKASGPGR